MTKIYTEKESLTAEIKEAKKLLTHLEKTNTKTAEKTVEDIVKVAKFIIEKQETLNNL